VSRMTVMQLILMTTAAVMSLRGVPLMSQVELTMFAYMAFAAVFFLVPAALVSAELGTTFADKGGGVYTWVKEAYNKKVGFVAVFMQWIQNIVWYPITITFGSAAIFYIIGMPELASNGKFIGAATIIIYWVSTWISLKAPSKIASLSSIGFIWGTIVPLVVLIGLAIYWMIDKNPIAYDAIPANQTEIAKTVNGITTPLFIPHLTSIGNIVFLSTIILLFSGIEALAVHANELDKPKTQYPKAIFIAAFLCFVVLGVGAYAVSVILPYNKIELDSGVMDAFKMGFDRYHLNWLTNIMAVLVVIGCVASVIAWISGPSKSLLYTAKDNELPKFMAVVDKNGVQINIILLQGVIVTILCSLYFFMENVNVAFFLLSSLNATLYLVMYVLMYLAGMKLRKSQPNLQRPFKVPGGKYGMFIFGGIGFIAVVFALILCFIPPSELPISSPTFYTMFLIVSTIFFILIPITISHFMNKKQ
jgi:glutamate:GABA antiporter